MKKKIKSEDFSAHNYIMKTSYFGVAPPGNTCTIAYTNIDYLLKNDKYIYPCLVHVYSLKILCLINVQIFINVP